MAKFISNKFFLINFFISFLPLSLIIGNLASNINILLVIVIGFLIFGKEIFFIKENKFNYILYIFFIYLIIITFINNIYKIEINISYKEHIIKSLLYLRYLLLFLVINKLIEKEHLNFKFLITSIAILSLIISFDIIVQVIFGKNLVGATINNHKPSSFFFDENIAGGYLQRFILFAILLIFLKFKIKSNSIKLIIFIALSIPIILTNNRMPTLIYFLIIFSYYLFYEKKIKQILILIFSFFLIFLLINKIPNFERQSKDIKNFISSSVVIFLKAPRLFYDNTFISSEYKIKHGKIITVDLVKSGYLLHFNSGVQQWKKKKIFGSGMKSFSLVCEYSKNQTCNTHPHNYFIEILLDTGVVGIIILYLVIFKTMFSFLKEFIVKNSDKLQLINFIFFILIFFEFFPIRSTGSFFTTSNSAYIFFILPFFFNFKQINKINLFNNKS